MALFQKEEKQPQRFEEPRATPPVSALAPSSGSNTEFQAVLGAGSRVEGRLTFDGSVRIDGQVDGEVNAQETVLIGENATVNAQIQANSVVVFGRLNGDIAARKRVELRAPARLVGNINTPCLVVHEGVTFEGHCSMGSGGENRTEKGDRKVAVFPKDATRATSELGS